MFAQLVYFLCVDKFAQTRSGSLVRGRDDLGGEVPGEQVRHVTCTATYWHLSQTAAQVSTDRVISWGLAWESQN